MNMKKCLFALVVMSVSATASAGECNLVSRSDDVVLMQCSDDANQQTWVTAAKAICLEDSRCNVWFWPAAVTLPQKAPQKDIELPKSLTSQATAVWANDTATLLQLKKKAP